MSEEPETELSRTRDSPAFGMVEEDVSEDHNYLENVVSVQVIQELPPEEDEFAYRATNNRRTVAWIECHLCDVSLEDRVELRDHYRLCHKFNFFCKVPNCREMFETEGALKRHMIKGHGNKFHYIQCQICPYWTYREAIFDCHHRKHVIRRVMCDGCDKTFFNDEECREHVRLAHNDVTECYHCQERMSAAVMVGHKSVPPCPSCKSTFRCQRLLIEHLQNCSPPPPRPTSRNLSPKRTGINNSMSGGPAKRARVSNNNSYDQLVASVIGTPKRTYKKRNVAVSQKNKSPAPTASEGEAGSAVSAEQEAGTEQECTIASMFVEVATADDVVSEDFSLIKAAQDCEVLPPVEDAPEQEYETDHEAEDDHGNHETETPDYHDDDEEADEISLDTDIERLKAVLGEDLEAEQRRLGPGRKVYRRTLNKLMRRAGLEYEGRRKTSQGVEVVKRRSRTLQQPCKPKARCRGKSSEFHCSTFNDVERKKIFDYVWGISNWAAKKSFITSLVQKSTVHRSRPGVEEQFWVNQYFLMSPGTTTKLRVCAIMFCSTIGFSESTIKRWVNDQLEDIELNNTMPAPAKFTAPEIDRKREQARILRAFLSSLSRLTPGNGLGVTVPKDKRWSSITQLYRHYSKEVENPVTKAKFSKAFEALSLNLADLIRV